MKDSKRLISLGAGIAWAIVGLVASVATFTSTQGVFLPSNGLHLVQMYQQGIINKDEVVRKMEKIAQPEDIEAGQALLSLPISTSEATADGNNTVRPTYFAGNATPTSVDGYFTVSAAVPSAVPAPTGTGADQSITASPGNVQHELYTNVGATNWKVGEHTKDKNRLAAKTFIAGKFDTSAGFDKASTTGGTIYPKIGVLKLNGAGDAIANIETCAPLADRNAFVDSIKNDVETRLGTVFDNVDLGYEGVGLPDNLAGAFQNKGLHETIENGVPNIAPAMVKVEQLKSAATSYDGTATTGAFPEFVNLLKSVTLKGSHTVQARIKTLAGISCMDATGTVHTSAKIDDIVKNVVQNFAKKYIAEGMVVDRNKGTIKFKNIGSLSPVMETLVNTNDVNLYQKFLNGAGTKPTAAICKPDDDAFKAIIQGELQKFANVLLTSQEGFKEFLAKHILGAGTPDGMPRDVLTRKGSTAPGTWFHESSKIDYTNTGVAKLLEHIAFDGDLKIKADGGRLLIVSKERITQAEKIKELMGRISPDDTYVGKYTKAYSDVMTGLGSSVGGSSLRFTIPQRMDIARTSNVLGVPFWSGITVVSFYKSWGNIRTFMYGDDEIQQVEDLVRDEKPAIAEPEPQPSIADVKPPTPGFFGRMRNRIATKTGAAVVLLMVTTGGLFGAGYLASIGNKNALAVLKFFALDNRMKKIFG